MAMVHLYEVGDYYGATFDYLAKSLKIENDGNLYFSGNIYGPST
jgi:hypothetical protein